MSFRQRLILLQLPRLDPDVSSPGENVMLAAACLQSALVRSPEGRHWELLATPATQDTADNATLLAAVRTLRPDVIGATLYLWNVERTLRLLAAVKQHLPQVRVVVGGPEVAREHTSQGHREHREAQRSPSNIRSVLSGLLRDLCVLPSGAIHRNEHNLGFAVDVAVIGEGETVFPGILAALRRGGRTNWRNVAWLSNTRVPVFGTRTPPTRPLRELLPPADHPVCRPDAHGMAYLETNRGCPMRCAFCCYNIRREGCSSLSPAEVECRIRVLRQRGAREIRLVDPTFNAHPRFRAVLGAMRRANADRQVRFFLELRADTLTEQDAAALAAANVVEAEVGVQSTDPVVLRCLHRPTRLERVLAGIERLQRHGIRPTIDFMYGLPHQGMDDIERALDILTRFPGAHPQLLPTLLLPGTELRDRAVELKLRAQPLPPYRVQATDRLCARQLAAIEELAMTRLGGFDSPTRRFVGQRLPDLFADRYLWHALEEGGPAASAFVKSPADKPRAGRSAANRRAVIFRGDNLFAQRHAIGSYIRKSALREPDMLLQFVLAPTREEPLDLLDFLMAAIRRLPAHWLDRLVSPAGTRRFAARRLFVQLPRSRVIDPDWRNAAESFLAGMFH